MDVGDDARPVPPPDVSLSAVQAFVEVAATGSFVSAADELGVHSTTVTKLVARLEEQLGVKLFERTTRHVELTAVGAGLLPSAEALMEAVWSFRLAAGPAHAEPA